MADVGFLYHLLSVDLLVDPTSQSVIASLNSGVPQLDNSLLEIRHGGSATNYELVSTILHQDSDVLLGLVDTDEAIALSSTHPTVALFAPLQKSPDIIYWNPDIYPKASSIADHNSWDVRVMYAQGAYFMGHLLSTRQLKSTQPVPTFDGTPIPFIASGGIFLQQGLATVDPFAYRYIYRDWMKDITFQYIHDAGWQPYALSVSSTPTRVTTHSDCLKVLIPALQNAAKDFVKNPEPTIARIVDVVRQFNTSWSYTASQARAALSVMESDGLIANGSDGVLGSFDAQRIFDVLERFRDTQSPETYTDISPESLVNNAFLNPAISLDNVKD